MPIPTDSEVWQEADEEQSLISELIEFFKDNSATAFNNRELADEFLDTNWEASQEEARERERLGDDEFYERLDAGEYDEFEKDVSVSFADTLIDQALTASLTSLLDHLEDEGKIERRKIPREDSDLEFVDFEEVSYYTYSN